MTEAVCPNCGAAVSSGARFCGACGRPIPAGRTCANCGAALSEMAQFCGSCGAPTSAGKETIISAPRPATAPPPPAPPVPAALPPRRRSWLPVLLGAAGLVVLCFCAGALLLAFLRGGGELGGLGGGLSWLTPSATETSSPFKAARLTPLVSKTLAPSADPQTLGEEGQVMVTIPGGLLNNEQTLAVSSVAGFQEPSFPVASQLVAAYEISLGELHNLDKPLIIEMAYDPAKLRGTLPPEESLVAMYWDEGLNDWVMLPSFVDTGRNTLVVLTKHLSDFVGAEFVSDGHIANSHFSLRYDPAEYNKLLESGGVFKEDKKRGHKDYLSTVWDSLNESRQGYVDADLRDTYLIKWKEEITMPRKMATADGLVIDFPVTRTKINYNVFVGGDSESVRDKFSGNIYIPYKTTYGPEGVRLMTGHEVFHAVQARYYTMAGMDDLAFFLTSRRWWIESTAEYAAARVAWKRELPGMGGAIIPRYLETSLTSSDRDHAYNTAWFIEFLVKDKVPRSNFADMFNYVATSLNPSVEMVLDEYLNKATGGKGLDLCYQDFAQYWIFNPDSGLASTPEGRIPPAAADWSMLKEDDRQAEHTFSLAANYTASLWGIAVAVPPDKPSRNLHIETPADSLPADTTIYVYVLQGRQRQPGGGKPAIVFNPVTTKSGDVAVTADDDLFVLAVNGGHSARQVTVNVSDTEVKPTTQPAKGYKCFCDGEPVDPLMPPMCDAPACERWQECYDDCMQKCGCSRDDVECINNCFWEQ
jgi:hypothetical protein